MSDNDVKVLYIAGGGRSGSTILHNLLGQLDGWFAVGELRYIWDRGLVKNRLCGCGVPFRECEEWQRILDRAFGGMDRIDALRMSELTETFRIRDLPATLVPAVRHRTLARLRPFLADLERLYTAIQQTTGCRVIVDSSKNPSYGYLVKRLPGVRTYVLHMVRDSLPVAYSWSQRKYFQPGERMPSKTPVEAALQWDARNLTAELFLDRGTARQRLVRYEDLMARPREVAASIVEWIGEDPGGLPFVNQRDVRLDRANHSVFGNEVRFQQGTTTLRLDERWKDRLPRRDALTVRALTWPLRRRYGYRADDVLPATAPRPVSERAASDVPVERPARRSAS